MDQPGMQAILRDLQSRPENKKCVDCGTANPQWATVTYGTFMCLECSGRHRSLGTHLSFVRSVGMDKWKEWEVLRMKHGGNAKFVTFAKENKIHGLGIQEKYQSHHAAVFAAKLKSEATGEPYVPPPAPGSIPAKKPVVGAGNAAVASSAGWDSWGSSQSAGSTGNGLHTGSGTQRVAAMGMGSAGVGAGFSSGGISSDMWNNQGGRGDVGRAGRQTDAFSMDKLSEGLNKGMSTIQSSELAGQAGKVASQAADSLKSWFGTVSSTVVNVAAGQDEADMRGNLLRNLGPSPGAGQGSTFEGFSSDQWRKDHAPPSLSSDEYRAQQVGMASGPPRSGKKMASLSSDQYRAEQASKPGVGGGLSSDQYRAQQASKAGVGGGLSSEQYRAMQSAGPNSTGQPAAGYQQQSAKDSGSDNWGGFDGDSKGDEGWGWGSG